MDASLPNIIYFIGIELEITNVTIEDTNLSASFIFFAPYAGISPTASINGLIVRNIDVSILLALIEFKDVTVTISDSHFENITYPTGVLAVFGKTAYVSNCTFRELNKQKEENIIRPPYIPPYQYRKGTAVCIMAYGTTLFTDSNRFTNISSECVLVMEGEIFSLGDRYDNTNLEVKDDSSATQGGGVTWLTVEDLIDDDSVLKNVTFTENKLVPKYGGVFLI